MSNTHKTNIQRHRHQLMKACNRLLRQVGHSALALQREANSLPCGVRYGNQRAAEAALKLKLRRLDRRAAQRSAMKRIIEDLRPESLQNA